MDGSRPRRGRGEKGEETLTDPGQRRGRPPSPGTAARRPAAARVDGATRWQLLRYVKLPLLKPTIKLSVFFAILGSFQLFDLVMPMTRGAPI